MNERERAEFERHKTRAEEQLNQMYYGANKKASKNGGFAMPPFLSPPNSNKNGEKAQGSQTAKAEPQKSEKSAKKPDKPRQSQPLKGGSILNFLNFKGMKMDNDRLVILAICLLLAGEEADELLILALIYIML